MSVSAAFWKCPDPDNPDSGEKSLPAPFLRFLFSPARWMPARFGLNIARPRASDNLSTGIPMASFHFRLENVLAYRKRLEEESMQALAGAVMRRDSLLARRDSLRKTQAEQRERLCRAQDLTGAERWLLQGFLHTLSLDLEAVKKDLVRAEEEVDRCRAALVQKAQERSLLESLREKQAASHAMLERQKEQREFDEAATLRYQIASV
jgi:flagellar FliJ protein